MKKIYFFTLFIFLFINSNFAQTNLSGTLPCNTTLTIGGSPYNVLSTIIVSSGCNLVVNPGVEIKMAENAHLIIKGKASFMGTASQPINMHASDTIWGNIFLDSTLAQKSSFNYVIIQNARKSVKVTQEPGAIYSFFSSLEIKNCHFKNNLRCWVGYQSPGVLIKDCILDSTNSGEKIHGQYCHDAIVDGAMLYATRGDADGIDFDASNDVLIANSKIYGGDDDGIDIGQCDSIGCDTVTVRNNYIFNMANKGVSNGEYCKNISIHHNVIVSCAIGIGAKSGAKAKADHNTLYGNRMGVKSYEHTQQIWGPGSLTVTNCIIANSDTVYHVDPTAFLSVSYTLADDTLIPGTGNIKGNPLFISPGLYPTADFHLNNNSPAINSGDPSFPTDPDNSRTDMGAFYTGVASVSSNVLFNEPGIFPNPAKDIFNIRFSSNASTGNSGHQIKIYNATGDLVYTENIFPGTFAKDYFVNLSTQPKGVYYLQIISDSKIIRSKLILN